MEDDWLTSFEAAGLYDYAPEQSQAAPSADTSWQDYYMPATELAPVESPVEQYVRLYGQYPSYPALDSEAIPADSFGPQWQDIGGMKVMINDDGTASRINPTTGETELLSQSDVGRLVDMGLLNSASSGYVSATGGAGNTPGGGTKTAGVTTPQKSPVSLSPIQRALNALTGSSGGSNAGILAALAPILLAMARGSGQSSGSGQSAASIPAMTASRSRLPYSKKRPGGEGQFSFFSPITYQRMAGGGIANLGGYSDGGRLLKGPGDGVSDDIPATIGKKQPARLADGEFVIPARIVSELGNGSTDAGARKLYAMMRRVEQRRKKTAMAGNSKADKHLPA